MLISYLLKDMYVNKMRLILTVIAVAWGTFSVASMLAVGEGLRLTFTAAVQSGPEALIITPGESTQVYNGQSNNSPVNFDQEDLKFLQTFYTNEALIAATSNWYNSIFYRKEKSEGAIIAVDHHYAAVHQIDLVSRLNPSSRFIDQNDVKFHRQVIVLGKESAKKLFKEMDNPVGKFVILAHRPFLVVGVQSSALQIFSNNRTPDNYCNWIPITTFQDLTKQDHFNNFIVAPFNLFKDKNLKKEIKEVIAKRKGLNPDDNGILKFVDLQDKKKKVQGFLYGLEIFLGLIGGLTLVVAGVGIVNVMFISIKRSTRNIGIKMAVGATSFHILMYYALEALVTTAIGGFFGILLTKIFVWLLSIIPMNSSTLEYFGKPKPILSFNVIFIVILFLGSLGFLAGIFPARKASLINPSEALRYE